MNARVLAAAAALALGAGVARADALPRNVFAVAPEDEVQDLVFFAGSQPVRLRLHIQVDGRGFRAVWDEFVRDTHRFLDIDGDGIVSAQEAGRGEWREMLGGGPIRFANSPPPVSPPTRNPDSDPADGVVSVAELADYLRPFFGPFAVQPGQAPSLPGQAAFAPLDRDGDGALTRAELEAADSSLARMDVDDDQVVTAQELTPFQSPFVRVVPEPPNPSAANAASPALVAIDPGEPLAKMAGEILRRYDGRGARGASFPADQKLDPEELEVGRVSFEGADADADGRLDVEELARWLGGEPDLELILRIGQRDDGQRPIEIIGPDGSTASLASRAEIKADALTLALDLVRIELRTERTRGSNSTRSIYLDQFKVADADNNKYLERKEVEQNVLSQLFAQADRDGDGKLFEEELTAFVDRQAAAADSRTLLSITDQGHGLFEAMDADGDRRLAVRELRRSADALLASDRDGDGRVALDEIARRYQLTLGRGQSASPIGVVTTIELSASRPVGPPKAGAAWFRKMDRNRDGDVSRREFLGPRDVFSRIDADGDGLIDAEEAAASP